MGEQAEEDHEQLGECCAKGLGHKDAETDDDQQHAVGEHAREQRADRAGGFTVSVG